VRRRAIAAVSAELERVTVTAAQAERKARGDSGAANRQAALKQRLQHAYRQYSKTQRLEDSNKQVMERAASRPVAIIRSSLFALQLQSYRSL
jgi:hypothetical protein